MFFILNVNISVKIMYEILFMPLWANKSDWNKLAEEYVSLIQPVNTKVNFLQGDPKLLARKVEIKFWIVCCFNSLSDIIAENKIKSGRKSKISAFLRSTVIFSKTVPFILRTNLTSKTVW